MTSQTGLTGILAIVSLVVCVLGLPEAAPTGDGHLATRRRQILADRAADGFGRAG